MKLKLEHNDQIEINFQSIWTTHDRLRTLDTDMVILVSVHVIMLSMVRVDARASIRRPAKKQIRVCVGFLVCSGNNA